MQTRFFLSDAWKHRVRAWKGSWTLKGGNRNFFAEPYHIWSEWWWPTERQKHKQRSFFSIPWSTQFEPRKKHSSQSSKERQECVLKSNDGFYWNLTCSKIWMNTDARKHWARKSTFRHISKEGQDWIYIYKWIMNCKRLTWIHLKSISVFQNPNKWTRNTRKHWV